MSINDKDLFNNQQWAVIGKLLVVLLAVVPVLYLLLQKENGSQLQETTIDESAQKQQIQIEPLNFPATKQAEIGTETGFYKFEPSTKYGDQAREQRAKEQTLKPDEYLPGSYDMHAAMAAILELKEELGIERWQANQVAGSYKGVFEQGYPVETALVNVDENQLVMLLFGIDEYHNTLYFSLACAYFAELVLKPTELQRPVDFLNTIGAAMQRVNQEQVLALNGSELRVNLIHVPDVAAMLSCTVGNPKNPETK